MNHKNKKNSNEIILQRISDHYEVKEHDIKTEEETLLGIFNTFDKAYIKACDYQDDKEPRYGLRIAI
jgi:hypothetical protein